MLLSLRIFKCAENPQLKICRHCGVWRIEIKFYRIYLCGMLFLVTGSFPLPGRICCIFPQNSGGFESMINATRIIFTNFPGSLKGADTMADVLDYNKHLVLS